MFENKDDIELALNNLEHAGVKGMKWGKRKASSPTEGMSRKERNQAIRDAQKNVYQTAQDVVDLRRAKLTASSKSGQDYISKNLAAKEKQFKDEGNLARKSTTGQKFATAAMLGLLGASVYVRSQ
jgi:hypothetical protein